MATGKSGSAHERRERDRGTRCVRRPNLVWVGSITVENQPVLIQQMEWRVRAQQERIQVLERLVGYEKLGLRVEIENLRRALRDHRAT